MKKIVNILLILSIILGGCFSLKSIASPSDIDAQLAEFKQQQKQLKSLLPFYTNLGTCAPYNGSGTYTNPRTSIQYNGSDMKIYGKVKGLCHIHMSDTLGTQYDCHVPMAVASTNSFYGKEVIKKLTDLDLEKTFSDENIKNQDTFTNFFKNMSNITKDLQKLQQLETTMMQYNCKQL